jgi:predicted phosphodiesterase
MKIAVLADIHGNLPALRAVLADVNAEAPDALVVAGDIVAGPLVRESLETVDRRPEPTYWISGNSERDAVRVFDSEPLVVGGHTHRQFVRPVRDGLRYANAGSIGLPYEGRRGAFWLVVRDGQPELRRTDYDFDAALAEMRASGFAALDDHFKESLITPADADGVSAFLEGRAGRN